MDTGDVIVHEGKRYTITCFYAPYFDSNIEKLKVTEILEELNGYNSIKVTAVRKENGYNSYVHIPIENATLLKNYIEKFQNVGGLWSAIKIAMDFPFEQESYKGQHAREVRQHWKEEDLVPNPGTITKRFKLLK